VQINDNDDVGIAFRGLLFWRAGKTYALGEQTNGFTEIILCFERLAEGRYALNNGEEDGIVITAFQVLQVKAIFEYVCLLQRYVVKMGVVLK
jgi:hypothetical protein